MSLDLAQAHDVLHRAVETDAAAIAVYEAAIGCAGTPALRDEWQRQRDAKQASRRQLEAAMRSLAIDPDEQTASRHVVRHLGQSLACAVKMAAQSVAPAAAELFAAECVVHAETACRHHWMLVERVARGLPGASGASLHELAHALEEAQEEQIERAEAWLAELSLAALGLPAALPADLPRSAAIPLGASRAPAARSARLRSDDEPGRRTATS